MGKSYYKEIDGKKYDAGILDAAAKAIEGNGDGRISQKDAEMLLKEVKDGDKYTDIEKHTVALLREKFKWTDAADEWFRKEIRKWAGEKGAKTAKKGGDIPLALVKSLRQRHRRRHRRLQEGARRSQGRRGEGRRDHSEEGSRQGRQEGRRHRRRRRHSLVHSRGLPRGRAARGELPDGLRCAQRRVPAVRVRGGDAHRLREAGVRPGRGDLTDAAIAKQEDIFRGQMAEEAKQTGKEKPEKVLEGIIEGKLAKWKKECVLLDQEFILSDDKKTVGAIQDELSAKIGEKVSIRRFVRYELGEGIEKKSESDLAAEVAATLAAATS